MKIIVNDIAADRNSGGAFTVLQSIYNTIKEYDTQNEWIFLLADNYFEETENIKILTFPDIKKSWIKRLLFDFYTGKKIINDLKGDVLFSLQNTSVIGVDSKQIVYLHQSIPYQKEKQFSFFKKVERKLAIYQKLIGPFINFSLKKADTVIVQTFWMKKSVNKKLKNKVNIEVVSPTVDLPSSYVKTSNASLNTTQFFFPAYNYFYKNHAIIFEAIMLLESRGITDFTVFLTLDSQEKSLFPDSKNVKFIGKLSLESVYANYKNKVLIFPSYIETFGLPLLEARLCNTIILAADTDFAREVLDGYHNSYLFDYQNPEMLATYMEDCINAKIQQHPTNNLNIAKYKENSWKKIIQLVTTDLVKESTNE
ncbi:glycosyltransferase [Carnobacterium maltaromaticum]|uniref:glycosyltransferase n=1 Tax=Carnobacterium maltaromaticum TaxID=2751 RepID=UPI000E716BEC|nr:glycosyltransferase [Carnobacterium maltaromaticum]AOA02779.1 hypothetical protein BFC23_09850 [Carnobacterium maltaromaticum]MCI1819295.1 glycosyltransferase [Carnobacterium maltaromaticum]